jgi:hypothetical protein
MCGSPNAVAAGIFVRKLDQPSGDRIASFASEVSAADRLSAAKLQGKSHSLRFQIAGAT